MKIRNGFVSNSSSSSFIITIHDNCYSVIENIYNEFIYSWFDVHDKNIIEHLNKKLSSGYFDDKEDTIKNLIERIENCRNGLLDDNGNIIRYYDTYNLFDTYSYDDAEDYDYTIKEITKIKYFTDIIIDILNYVYSIDVEIDIDKNIKFIGWTIMKNSFSDCPEILKDILTYYTFTFPDIKIDTEERGD